jgi:hypothetical protein
MNTNINFAMTFPPEKTIIIGLLNIADGVSQYSLDEISSVTGIPKGNSSGKVKPNIDYAQAMGLINFTSKAGMYILTRTKLAEIIYQEDFGLNETLTMQMLNYFMSSESIGTSLWNLLIRNKSIVSGDFIDSHALETKLERDHKKSVEQQQRVISPLKSAHRDFFSSISFIEESLEKRIKINKLSVNSRFVFMYAYTLLFDWEALLYDKSDVINEIDINKITSTLKWAEGFHWSEKDMFEALELISEKQIIKINKQLTPATVIKNSKSEDILNKLYSLI